MIGGHTISVLVTTYRRFGSIDKVCAAWLEELVDEVWLLDNSGGGARSHLLTGDCADDRFMYWPLPQDFGTRADYGVSPLTKGDYLIFADDDVLPKTGFATDLYTNIRALQAGFVGIIGRVFDGPDYYDGTRFFAANKVESPMRVGFTGVVYMCERALCGFDVRGMGLNCDDLWHQMRVHTFATKYVVPTKQYENLPECEDDEAMFHRQDLRDQRAKFYTRYYDMYYRPKGRRF